PLIQPLFRLQLFLLSPKAVLTDHYRGFQGKGTQPTSWKDNMLSLSVSLPCFVLSCPHSFPTEVCKLPADPGHCLAYLEQYYYNWNTRKCETFVYGMCNGNGNHFTTKLECQMVCGEFGKEQERT
uniref:BPTI/Kunitz inhibitor domain-containing protein n=1 Tax=Naja naja TaxID=35670 RepID=A0A8C6Y2N7_NAJNA